MIACDCLPFSDVVTNWDTTTLRQYYENMFLFLSSAVHSGVIKLGYKEKCSVNEEIKSTLATNYCIGI